MKKFLALMCSVLVLCLSFAGCSDGWTEVQSIIYSVGGHNTTYTSKVVYEIESETMDKTSYDALPENQKNYCWNANPETIFVNAQTIPTDRKNFIDTEEQLKKPTKYCQLVRGALDEDHIYFKVSILDYQFQYVKVKQSGDGEIQIQYYEDDKEVTISVISGSHEITYFED